LENYISERIPENSENNENYVKISKLKTKIEIYKNLENLKIENYLNITKMKIT